MRAFWWACAAALSATACVDFDGPQANFCSLRPDVCGVDGGAGGGVPTGGGSATGGGATGGGATGGGAAGGGATGGGATGGGATGGGATGGGATGGGSDAGVDAGIDAGSCGDHITNAGELCDDGNASFGDGCDPTCQYVDQWQYFSGQPYSQGYADSTTPAAARFYYPLGLTTDRTTVWLADWGTHAVREIDIATGAVSTLFGGPIAQAAITDGGGMVGPVDVHYQPLIDGGPGFLYVADSPFFAPTPSRVYRIDVRPGQLNRDPSLYLGANIDGLVAMTGGYDFFGSDRIAVLTASGVKKWRVVGSGAGSDSPLADKLQLDPFSVGNAACLDVDFGGATSLGDGGYSVRYYVACPSTIVQIIDGAISLLGGHAGEQGCVDGPVPTARVHTPARLSTGSGVVTFLDQGCGTVRQVNVATGAVSTVVGPGDGGLDEGPNLLVTPSALSSLVWAGNDLFIGDGPRLRRVGATNTTIVAGPVLPLGPAPGYGPQPRFTSVDGLASDGTHVYAVVSYLHELFRVSLSTGASERVAALTNFNMGQFPGPVAKVGTQVYVAYANGTIRRVDLSQGVPDGGAVAGSLDTFFSGSGSSADAVKTMTSDGTQIYFASGRNQIAVLRVDAGVSLIAGMNNGSMVQDGIGTAAAFARPQALTWAAGDLYLLDGPAGPQSQASVVRKISLDAGVVTTLIGQVGALGFSDELTADAGTGRFGGAAGLASDGRYLFIGDPSQGAYSGDPNGALLRVYDLQTRRLGTLVGTRGVHTFLPGVGRMGLTSAPSAMVYDAARHRLLVFDSGESVFATYH